MKKIFWPSLIFLLLSISGICAYFYYQNKPVFGASEYFVDSNKNTLSNTESSTIHNNQPAVRVPILVYHSVRPYFVGESNSIKVYDVDPIVLEKQLEYLKLMGYTSISFDDLVNYFNGKKLPDKPVIISFDDGLETQYINAFPILKKENMKATFFIFSNAIGHKTFLTWDQVRELADAGMEIGGHSKSHPRLWKISDPAQLKIEIVDSKKIIEDHIGKTINAFAYPFGLYSPITIGEIKAAGYTSARTLFEKMTHTKDELYTLHSVLVSNDMKRFEGVLKHVK